MLKSFRQVIAELIYPEGPEDRRSLQRRLEVDPLTGMGNKLALELALPAAEADPNLAVIVIDLNNLGKANKIDGHGRGDWLIRRAAKTIRLFTRQLTGGDRTFRFGGDEFVVICDRAYALDLCYILRDRFGKHRLSDNTVVSLSGAVGETFLTADMKLQNIKQSHKIIEAAG